MNRQCDYRYRATAERCQIVRNDLTLLLLLDLRGFYCHKHAAYLLRIGARRPA